MKEKKWGAVDALYWLGGALVAAGVGLWSPAAGLVSAGVFCLAGAVLIDLSAKANPKKEGDGA